MAKPRKGFAGPTAKGKALAFAQRLKAAMKSKGLTGYALAQLSGISKQTINDLENAKVSNPDAPEWAGPSWSTMQKLAAALGISCESFMDAELAGERPATKKKK